MKKNIKPIKLIVMADYCCGLFLPEGATSPELLGLPSGLCVRFNEWLKLYDESDPAPALYKQARYYGQGRRLAQEIAEAMKDRYQVFYRELSPSKRPGIERHWREDEITGVPVIELSISAGHSCSVHIVAGGLQPNLEDLPIPPEFYAKLEVWLKKYDATCFEPLFSGRKAHDAEGLEIAKELQRAVGKKKIQVVFRHWVDFDPKQWRRFYREENLFTGECKEFWIEGDLPDDLAKKVVKIFPDCCGMYLWDLDGCCIGNEDPAFPDDLDKRFTAWSESWDAACDNSTTFKIDKARLAAERFDERGLELAAELKRCIRDQAKVIYLCTLRKASLEVLEDGNTIEWPYGTDFRQWALDTLHGGNNT